MPDRGREWEDPALFIAGFRIPAGATRSMHLPARSRMRPIEVCAGPATGLPMPAHAEIVLEGSSCRIADVTLLEGPFGEFTGYYAATSGPRR